jgi:hypothetical protein
MSADVFDTLAYKVMGRIDGGKRLKVVFARIGGQRYQDGVVVRSPEDLFSKSTIRSLIGAPVKLNHGGPTVGRVVDVAPVGGTHLAGTVEIDDEHVAAVNAAPPFLSGEWRGKYGPPDRALADVFGEHAHVAREIEFTGMAIGVSAPRCGESCARADCDECGGTCNPNEGASNMGTKKIESSIESLRAERDEALGKLAALTVAQKQDAADDATTEEKIAAEVAARVAVIQRVAPHVSSHIKLDSKPVAEIMRIGIAALRPDISLDGKSADFVKGVFDSVVSEVAHAAARARELVVGGNLDNADAFEGDNVDSVESAREQMIARNRRALVPRARRNDDADGPPQPKTREEGIALMKARLAGQFVARTK